MKKQINLIIIFGILIICTGCGKDSIKENISDRLHNMVRIHNEGLKKVLKDYYMENLSGHKKGVIIVDFSNSSDTSIFFIRSSFLEDLEESPPSHYTILDKVPVLFYTGLENYILFDSLYLNNLSKDVSPFLELYIEDEEGNIIQVPPTHNPIVWKVESIADNIRIEVLK